MTGAAQHRAPDRVAAEGGAALVLALVVTVLGVIIVGAMTTMIDWSGDRTANHKDRAQNVAVIDRALTSYAYALEANLTHEGMGFRLDAAALNRLVAMEAAAGRGNARVVANGSLPASFNEYGLRNTWMTGAYAQTVRVDLDSERTAWWQVVNLIAPGAGTGPDATSSLIAYIRTWVTKGDAVITEPRIARAELRPGRFSDYQMLVDGPLVLGGGTTIRGRVHSNGYTDAYLIDSATTPGVPLQLGNADGPPACVAGASFSTAAGSIGGTCSGFAAPRDVGNGRRIDLLRGREHLRLLKTMCGGVVFCPGGSPPWRFNLSSGTVNGIGIPGSALAVYVEGDAEVRGSTTRRITLGIAGRPGTVSAFGSSSVTLTGGGTIGSRGTAGPGDGTVGMIVEGDLIPDLAACPSRLNAAIISASGSLAVPPSYRTPQAPGGATPSCPSFTLTGSMATHYAPLMYLDWGVTAAGFHSRDYRYDTRLRTNPPPLFPLTGPWQISSWKDAMPECLTAAQRTRSSCG